MFKKLVGLLAFCLLVSCNGKTCYETTEVKVFCDFYSLTPREKVQIDSVSVWGLGSDSLIYKSERIETLALELNPKTEKTSYVVQIHSDGRVFTDTIRLDHTNRPWFQSMECGCMVFSKLNAVHTFGTIFKSAEILDSTIINKKTEHVILYI